MKYVIRNGLAAAAALALPLTAQAADMRAPLYKAPVEAFSWTGIYVGMHVGAGWGTKEWDQFIGVPGAGISGITSTPSLPLESDSSHAVNGFLGGAQIGLNVQTGWAVWGAEFQYSWADLKGRGNCGFLALWNCSSKVDRIATLAARVGLALDHTLVYVKGGGAWTHDSFDLNLLGINLPGVTQPSSLSDTRSGWMVGTGIEHAVSNNLSAKVEYNYMDLGTKRYAFNTVTELPSGVFDNFDTTQHIHLIKFGINYRFGFGGKGVVTKY